MAASHHRPDLPDRYSDKIQLFSTGGRAQLTGFTIWQLKSAWQ